MADQRFPKSAWLLKPSEFQTVYQGGRFAADNVLVVKATLNSTGQSRLGLAISRKVGNAVVRNRWKRALREAFRHQRHGWPIGLDLVVRPRKGAVCQAVQVHRSLDRLVRRMAAQFDAEAGR